MAISPTELQAMLDDLERAIASGARKVQYQDRAVTYHSQAEMLQAAERLRRQLGLPGRIRRTVVATEQGLGGETAGSS